MVTAEKIAELKRSGLWGVRTSNNGVGHGGFVWPPVGEWAVCPKWTGGNKCDDGGLFFQGPGAWGYAQYGSRFELIETDAIRILVDDEKAKTPRAKIIAVGSDAMRIICDLCDGLFPGSLYLSDCDLSRITLPQSVGGRVYK